MPLVIPIIGVLLFYKGVRWFKQPFSVAVNRDPPGGKSGPPPPAGTRQDSMPISDEAGRHKSR
jgi:hypothetical protein